METDNEDEDTDDEMEKFDDDPFSSAAPSRKQPPRRGTKRNAYAASAAEGDEDDDDEMECDNEAGGDECLDGDDYVGKRVAAFREGSIRRGTVTECGKEEVTDVIGWNIEFLMMKMSSCTTTAIEAKTKISA